MNDSRRAASHIEARHVAALVLTELARAAKVATWTVAWLMVAVWVFSGVDTGAFVFPGRYLFALLPLMLVWFTLSGSSDRLAQRGRFLPTKG